MLPHRFGQYMARLHLLSILSLLLLPFLVLLLSVLSVRCLTLSAKRSNHCLSASIVVGCKIYWLFGRAKFNLLVYIKSALLFKAGVQYRKVLRKAASPPDTSFIANLI